MSRPLPPLGSLLAVQLASGSDRYAQLTITGLVSVDGHNLGSLDACRSWRLMTADERADWAAYRAERGMGSTPPAVPLLEQLGRDLATLCVDHGAPLVSKAIDAIPSGHSRDELLCAAISELRGRGREGLAQQLAAFRFVERRAS